MDEGHSVAKSFLTREVVGEVKGAWVQLFSSSITSIEHNQISVIVQMQTGHCPDHSPAAVVI